MILVSKRNYNYHQGYESREEILIFGNIRTSEVILFSIFLFHSYRFWVSRRHLVVVTELKREFFGRQICLHWESLIHRSLNSFSLSFHLSLIFCFLEEFLLVFIFISEISAWRLVFWNSIHMEVGFFFSCGLMLSSISKFTKCLITSFYPMVLISLSISYIPLHFLFLGYDPKLFFGFNFWRTFLVSFTNSFPFLSRENLW